MDSTNRKRNFVFGKTLEGDKENITVIEIVEKYLRENGYGGLTSQDCCCDFEYLMECEERTVNCVPGKKVLCKPEDCDTCEPYYCEGYEEDKFRIEEPE
jgi:hypothetical protein